jgi:4-hydroxybenzoate polyprenyltransferase/phosphoserine phosphatase
MNSPVRSGRHGSVWDLDHTLVTTDTFIEQMTVMLLRQPWLLVFVCAWLLRGRSYCKGRVAAMAATPPNTWPIRAEILDRIADDRALGRTIVLATAAHCCVAKPLADHLGCFDAVIASDDSINLKSQRKAVAIAQMAANEGWVAYSYAGDCAADLPVWQEANEIVVVHPTRRLLSHLRRLGKPLSIIGAVPNRWALALKACRPHQWAKNLLLFVPPILAHKLDAASFVALGGAFVAFSLCASGIYVMNDIGDVMADRQHPRKKLRPFASGQLPIVAGICLASALVAAGLGISIAWLPQGVLGLLLLYLGANLAYSGRLKQIPVLDVLMLACMYALRLEAGAVAAHVPLSAWLLTFSLFFFTSLAFAKRFTELRRLESAGASGAAGRGYEVGDVQLLQMLGAASGYVSIFVLALYMNSSQMQALYGESRILWVVCPVMLYWITRLWLLANRGQLDEDPVVFALRDRTSLGVGAICGVIVILASIMAKAAQ